MGVGCMTYRYAFFTFIVICPDSFYNKDNTRGYYDLGGNV